MMEAEDGPVTLLQGQVLLMLMLMLMLMFETYFEKE